MKTTQEYLNAAKTALGIESDYGMAKWLGISTAAMAQYRKQRRVIDDYTAAKIADALGVPPIQVIAAANFEREKDAKRKDFWEKFSVGIAAGMLLLFLFPTDGYEAAGKIFLDNNNIHYAQSRKRRNRLFGFLFGKPPCAKNTTRSSLNCAGKPALETFTAPLSCAA